MLLTHGMKASKGYANSMLQMAYASTIGMIIIMVVLGSLWLGDLLDKRLGTGIFFSFTLLLMGLVGGFTNMYFMIKKHFRDELEIIKNIKNEAHRKRPFPNKN